MTIAVSILLALAFLGAGAAKLVGVEQSDQMRDHLGIGVVQWRVIGVLEVAGAVGVLLGLAVSALGAAAAAGLLLTSLGGAATHLRAGDPPKAAMPVVVLGLLSAATLLLQVL